MIVRVMCGVEANVGWNAGMEERVSLLRLVRCFLGRVAV